MADPSTWLDETAAAVDDNAGADTYAYGQDITTYYDAGGYETYDQQQPWDPTQQYEGDAGAEKMTAAYTENAAYDYSTGYDSSASYDYGAAYGYGADGQPLAVDWNDPSAYADAYHMDGEASYFAMEEADPNAPTSPFGDKAYWQQYGEVEVEHETYQAEGYGYPQEGEEEVLDPETTAVADIDEEGDHNATADSAPTTGATLVSTPLSPEGAVSMPPSSSSSSTKRKKKPKTKQERVQMRQQQLEKEEEEKATDTPADGTPSSIADSKPGAGKSKAVKSATKQRAEAVPLSFLDRERAKLRLRLRQARAIARKRMPIQIRVLTETRKNLSPMEIYFGGAVETALSDVFWAATKGDLRRVRFLVEVEKVSVTDCQLDPWQMEQTPLHWAAKGGSSDVVEYLLQAGASPRVLDETGSMPLHLACWAGHIDATLALLRATDTKDLYIRDYDAALAPLDWASLRGHTKLVKAIEKYEDSKWLPKFVDDLIRGIIRYKIKLFKELPKGPKSPSRGINFRRPRTEPTESAAATMTAPDNQATTDTDPGKPSLSIAKSEEKTAVGNGSKDTVKND